MKVVGVFNQIDPPSHGRTSGDFGNKGEFKVIANLALLVFAVEYPGPGVRYVEQIKQGGLFNLILYTFIVVITGKGFFAHRIKQLGIKRGRIVYFIGLADHLGFFGAVIAKIRPHAQRQYIFALSKTRLQGYNFLIRFHY